MDIFKEIAPLKKYLRDRKMENKMIGLVPTMGALHEGHLALIKSSKAENDITVSTIFVNPTQFNNKSDLEKYPKTYEADIALLEEAGCEVLFCPDDKEIYGKEPLLSLDFGNLAIEMEGKFRPGHFSGVGLIVSKLFNIVSPDRGYFGQKDLQQFFVIQQLVQDLSFDVELRCEPIVREKSGLAMSSRNMRLSKDGRDNASTIFKQLEKAAAALKNGVPKKQLISDVSFALKQKNIELEYLETVDADTIQLVDDYSSSSNIAICIAAFIEGVRLIDNIIITLKD